MHFYILWTKTKTKKLTNEKKNENIEKKHNNNHNLMKKKSKKWIRKIEDDFLVKCKKWMIFSGKTPKHKQQNETNLLIERKNNNCIKSKSYIKYCICSPIPYTLSHTQTTPKIIHSDVFHSRFKLCFRNTI